MAKRKRKTFEKQSIPTNMKVGSKVQARLGTGYIGYGVGTILEFLDEKSAPNNGAPLIQFFRHPVWGDIDTSGPGIRPYVNASDLELV